MKKYKLVDIEDEESNIGLDTLYENQVMESIREWNDEMGTNYTSIEDFNEKEGYFMWIEEEE
jgi:hypothetical protein